MEINITEKYAKDFSDGKSEKYLKTTEEGTFFTGGIKFTILDTDSPTKKIEISFWVPGAKEPIFIAKETFPIGDGAIFTFEPFTIQVGLQTL